MQNFIQKIKSAIGPTTVYNPLYYGQPQAPQTPQLDREKFLAALASNETGIIKNNPYGYSRSSGYKSLGKALGKYQVTEGELKTHGQRYLGQNITPQQFLASTTAQDKYVLNKADYYMKQGYTPQQVADIHNKGYKNSSAPGQAIYQNPDYVNKFNANYGTTTGTSR